MSERAETTAVAAKENVLDRLETPTGRTLLLGVIVAVALAARLWQLGAIPTVFFHDECDNTVNAIQILDGKGPLPWQLDWKPQPALAVNLIAASLEVFGPSVASIRMPSVLLSVATLVVFFLAARGAAGALPALLASLPLAFSAGFLHFSRSGWENVQICFYTLAAMVAWERALAKRHVGFAAAAGALAALGAMTYFAGRLILPILLVYAAGRAISVRGERLAIAKLTAALALTFVVVVAPLVPQITRDWSLFNRRSTEVLITSQLGPDAGLGAVARLAADNAWNSLTATVAGKGNHQPRYAPIGDPLIGHLDIPFLVIGLIASLWRLGATGSWWCALLLPFFFTQVMTQGAPNLARGIALLPIAYLFVALGLATTARLAGRRPWAWAILLGVVIWSAGAQARRYFEWAASPETAAALQPAVELADFDAWWTHQNEWTAQDRGFFNVGMWLELRSRDAPVALTAAPEPEAPPAPPPPIEPIRSEPWQGALDGTVYTGSTTSQPIVFDLGTIEVTTGKLRVTVSAVEGSDAVYDFLEIVDDRGGALLIEAEDPVYTTGDTGVKDHLVDHRWWLQNYQPFSGWLAFVALGRERPPPLVTVVDLAPGEYRLRLGSFAGDPANGPFAVRVLIEG